MTIVGGGATGVELAGTLAELRNIGLPASYPDIHPRCVHIRLVEMAPYLLGPYVPPLREYARRQLVSRGVDLHLNATIREITANRIILDSGEEIPSDLTAWAAGVAGPPVVGKWGLPQGKGGRLLVGPDLRVEGQERIFATGDIALTGDWRSGLAAREAGAGGAGGPGRRSGSDHAGDPEHVDVLPGQLLEQVRQHVQAGIGREHHRDRAPMPGLPECLAPACLFLTRFSADHLGADPEQVSHLLQDGPRAGHYGGTAQLAGRAGGEQVPGAWSGADQGEPPARPDPGYRHARVA